MTNLPGLNFQLGEDIDALRDAVRDFAQAEIAPRAAEPTSPEGSPDAAAICAGTGERPSAA